MNLNQSFVRKIIYLVLVALLLFPIYRLGQPATVKEDGGTLAQMRSKYGMSQAQLGEIDPASESIKLATLGLKAFAVNYLWGRAQDQKKKEEYDNLEVTVNQIITLQPNFITIWEYQAHNLAYNVSVQFDDYRHRYQWVRKGINFLVKGTRFNRSQPRLEHYAGWITGHKIGRSDERKYFRQIYRDDTDFHDELSPHINMDEARGSDNKPDNWLTARQWYVRAEDVVDRGGSFSGKMTMLVFYSHRPMSRINYAAGLEEDGKFDDDSQLAYQRALQEWISFGNQEIPTPFGNLVLSQRDQILREADETRNAVVAMKPEVLEKLKKQKYDALPAKAREALEKPDDVRSDEEKMMAFQAQMMIGVPTNELAEAMPPDLIDKARELARLSMAKESLLQRLNEAHSVVNYDYWKTRCEVEQMDDAILARRLVQEAEKLYDLAQPRKAKEKFEQAWDVWDRIYRKYPKLIEDTTAEELMDPLELYVRVLEQLELELPKDFKLKRLLEIYEFGANQIPADANTAPFKRPNYPKGQEKKK